MFRKLFLVIAPILFIVGILMQVYFLSALGKTSVPLWMFPILWVVSLLWMIIMAGIYGSLYKKKWALVAESILFVTMFFAAFYIHKFDTDIIVLIAPLMFFIIYLIHFFLKGRAIKILDILKLLFIFSSLVAYEATNLGSDYDEIILGIWLILVISLFIGIWIQVYKFKKTAEVIPIAENGDDIFNYSEQANSNNN